MLSFKFSDLFFYVCEKQHWSCDGDCTESLDFFWLDINSLSPGAWKILSSISSSMFHSFHCRGLASQTVYSLVFGGAIVNVNIFLISSQAVHSWYIEKLQIFVSGFCILLLCGKCLLHPGVFGGVFRFI
jgi:hypothetical protein